MKQKFDVNGMSCSACAAHVEKSVHNLEGVKDVSVNLLSNSMNVSYDTDKLSEKEIVAAVVNAGYSANAVKPASDKSVAKNADINEDDEIKSMKNRFITSLIFLIPLFYISMGHMVGLPLPQFFHGYENAFTLAFTQFLLTLPIVFINRRYYITGIKQLIKRAPTMDTLIAIGSAAAVLYGIYSIFQISYGFSINNIEHINSYVMDLYFESACTILTLITLGKYLESRAKGKTGAAITKLLNLSPKTATVIRNGIESEIPIEDLLVGDIVLIRPGQSIPVDGVIIEGSSSVDESAITGESIPVEKQAGDKVISATINKSGSFKFKAEKVGEDTTISQIVRLIEEAASSKAPISRLADKVSGIFVPVVITIAVIAAVVWLILGYPFSFALSIGIAVLVISCPCALGLATPVAIMVGTGRGAEDGILIKSAVSLEITHKADTVVLDKTGTITIGHPEVTDIITLDDSISKDELLTIAASLENPSEHPLAEAIITEAKNKSLNLINVSSFNSVPGMGISAKIKDGAFLAGNMRLMKEHGIDSYSIQEIADSLSSQGKTPLFFAKDKKIIGIIAVADTIKPTSQKAIDKFKEMGLDIIMMTGDNKNTALAIKEKLGLKDVISDVFPQDKESKIRELQSTGKTVIMIGDGINDSPALTRADIGIAIGAGSDIAIESADIILMKSDLMDAVRAIRLSRGVIRNIRENLFWAFFYNVIGIPLAAGILIPFFGIQLSPMFAAAAMSLSSVTVVTNALRLKLLKLDKS
ncbi:MAG: heavy metal translocating P-type ATPase [Eubacteriales bacterium]